MPTSTHVFNNDTHTVVLTIDLPVNDYMPVVEKKLKEYRNTVQLKGFRTGEVPMSFLRAKFGNSILAEEVQTLINSELGIFVESSKLNLVGSPLPMNKYDASIQKPKDVSLDIEIGFIPEFEVAGISTDFSMPFYNVEVDDGTLEKEIENQRKRLSSDFEENVKDILHGDSLSVCLRESENGTAKLEGHFNDETIVNLDKVTTELKEKLLNAEVGGKLIASLADLDTDVSAKRAKKLYFGITSPQSCSDEIEIEIKEIKRVKKRELNTKFFKELFQYEDIEDEEAFRIRMSKAISEGFESAIYNIYNRAIFEHLMEQNKNLPLPVAFLRRFIEETQTKGKKLEDAQFQELLQQLIWGTITNKLAKDYNVVVSQQDVETEMRMAIVRHYGFQISPFHNLFDNQVQKMMQDEETYRKYQEEVQESKIFAAMDNQFVKDIKTVSSNDFSEVYDQHFSKQKAKDEEDADKLEQILDGEMQ